MNDTSKDAPAVLDLSAVPFQPYYRDEHCVIYNADCRKVLPFLPKFDLLLTDPPYGIGAAKMNLGFSKSSRLDKQDWDDLPPTRWTVEMMLETAVSHIVWGGNYFALPQSRNYIVWDKGPSFRQRDFAECEMAWCSWDAVARVMVYDPLANGDYKDRVHKTQKPLSVFRWCLSLCPDAKTVLDCYAGSLTTAVACKLENKFCVCIEASEAYCEKGVKRLEQGVLF